MIHVQIATYLLFSLAHVEFLMMVLYYDRESGSLMEKSNKQPTEVGRTRNRT